MNRFETTSNSVLVGALLGSILLLSSCSGGGGGGGSKSGGVDEGAVDNPVTVTVGNTSTRTVGAAGVSYYQFMAPSTANYTIALTNTKSDLSWTLYSDAFFANFIAECDDHIDPGPANESCIVGNLTEGTTYYLSVDEWDDRAGSFTLLISAGS